MADNNTENNVVVDNNTLQTNTPATQEQNTTPAQPAVKTFTQEEVNRIAAQEKNEGRKSVLNKYGLTEEQLAAIAPILNPQKQAAAQAVVAPSIDMEMARRVLVAEAKSELALSGVRNDAVEDMVLLVTAELKPDDYKLDDIKERIKQIKTRHAGSFATQTTVESGTTTQTNTSGTGGNFAGNTQTTTTAAKSIGDGNPGSIGKMLAEKKLKQNGRTAK